MKRYLASASLALAIVASTAVSASARVNGWPY